MSRDSFGREASETVSRFEDTYLALCNVVQTLTCSLCHKLMNNPSTFSTCGHTFCWNCVVSTLEGKGIVSSVCPECRQPGWKNDLQANHLMMNLIGQVTAMMKQLSHVRIEERKKRKRVSENDQVERQEPRENQEEDGHQQHASPPLNDGMHARIEELKHEVALIEAVLDLCRTMPVAQMCQEEMVPDGQMIQKELSVVPDSQDESQFSQQQYLVERKRSIGGRQVLKERSMNQAIRVKEPQPPKTVRRMWWKAKPRSRDGPIKMVVDMSSIEDSAHIKDLVDTFVSTFADKVSVEKAITRETTHVVVGTDSALVARATPAFLQACTVGCWVVSYLWIDASNQNNGAIVEEKNYQVHGHRLDGQDSIVWSLPENSRLRGMAGKRGIFDGFTFVIGSLERADKDLVRLIELAGGIVVEHPPEERPEDMKYVSLTPGVSGGTGQDCMSVSWVYDCIGLGKLLNKEPYIA